MDPQSLFQLKGGTDIENRLRESLSKKLLQGKLKADSSNDLSQPISNGSIESETTRASERLSLSSSNDIYSATTNDDEPHRNDSSDMPCVRSAVVIPNYSSAPSTSAHIFRPSSVVQVVKNSSDRLRRRNRDEACVADHSRAEAYDESAYKRETYRRRRSPDSNMYDRPFYEYSQDRSYHQDEKDCREDSKRSRKTCSSEKLLAGSISTGIDPATTTSKNIPEHIKWLHDRWSKYDSPDFFSSKGSLLKPADLSGLKPKQSRSPINQTCVKSSTKDASHQRSNNRRRRSAVDAPNSTDSVRKLSLLKSDYMNWHYGGLDRNQLPYLLSFKEFLLSLSEDVGDTETEQIKAMNLYTEYKMNFKRRAYREFFDAHRDEEWFLQKYHPNFKTRAEAVRKEIVQKRLDVFMFLLVRGWIEAHVEYTDSRKIRKLLDAACILLQDGKEADILLLSDFDYVLEEKRELSYEFAREQEEKERAEVEEKNKNKYKDDEDNSNGYCDMEDLLEKEKQVEETRKRAATELEIAQHARDYTKFVSEHTEEVALPAVGEEYQPPNLPKIAISKNLTETRYIGDGVFVQRPKLILADKTPLSETILHRALSLCLRDVSPKVFRRELEEICSNVHGGFMRLYMSEPDPQRDFCRQAIASFWANANVMKICWELRARRLHTGQSLNVIEYRDFSKRIDLIDGLASDKSIVLRDIQLCKNLIDFLDRRHRLWCAEEGQTAMTNPLLNNLDECLTFHLQQLIQSGQIKDLADIDATMAEAENPVQSKNVDRDENLIRILDRLILYLRIVHSVDYYGCKFYENEDYEPRRIGLIHLRGPCYKQATPKQLADHIRTFEENLQLLLPNETRLADEHAELLGKKELDDEAQKFLDNNIIGVKDGLSKCCVCYKRFTSLAFAQDHFKQNHRDVIEEHKLEITAFNNYLYDPNRLCHIVF